MATVRYGKFKVLLALLRTKKMSKNKHQFCAIKKCPYRFEQFIDSANIILITKDTFRIGKISTATE